MSPERMLTILVVDDDPDDRRMTQEAFAQARIANPTTYLADGAEAMDYLLRRNAWADPGAAPRPGLILLDLNMPKKDGREVLFEIRHHPDLQHIPVVVLTGSRAEEDVVRSYQTGANSFICKPVSFEGLTEVMKGFGRYWLELVELPPSR